MRLAPLLLLASCVVASPSTVVEVAPISVRGAEAVWKLHSPDFFCSSFPVACRPAKSWGWTVTFMTAKHCLEGQSSVWVSHHSGVNLLSGNVVAVHPTEDVGLVDFFSQEKIDPRRLSFVPVEFGEDLVAAGYPAGIGPFVTRGVASTEGFLSADGFPGTSGGPVAKTDGTVVGITTAVLEAKGHLVTFAQRYTPLSRIENWLLQRLRK